MAMTVRRVTYEDQPEYQRLGSEAFGGGPRPVPARELWESAPDREWGVFDDGALASRLRVYGITSWFHGGRIPTAGIAGVAVEPERRGNGLVGAMFDAALAEARERGEAISTLFPSAPGIYRRLGYEVIGSFDDVDVQLDRVARTGPPAGVTTRRATVADVEAITAVHAAWASGQNGPLSRTEQPFWTPPEKYVGDYTGITLAVQDGVVSGFASWIRGTGDNPADTMMEVDDLIALTPEAARALWLTLGTFSTVVGTARVATSGSGAGMDPAWLVLPDLRLRRVAERPYMLRVLDVERALEGAWLAPVAGDVPFAVRGPEVGLSGAWTIEVSGGVAHLERTPVDLADAHHDRPVLTANGLALLYAGAQSARNLRLAGHLEGPETWDGALSAMFSGRQVHVRDYF
ncbi:GNAT family N-acetyltransferase [Myceligenerans indicum]|uniref:GNAT family N-acetyltransferase n=1 Tax=Myceligenerans indicum TaxID=2593663 RepID=A0ABS1LLU2_9MICO|nr:GNAT family N-acetyltransferase [Myceligenerans indicum]MBL0886989.1 GNAT family N-acetyltransferase [Myceligenerans indicum]